MLLQCTMKVLKSCPAYQIVCGDTLCVLVHVLRAVELTFLDHMVVRGVAWLTESCKIYVSPSCISIVSVNPQNVGCTETYSPGRNGLGR